MSRHNLYAALVPPSSHGGEILETLLVSSGVRIERIVSTGQASPPGFWYDQKDAEWVVLLQGGAKLRYADETEDRLLVPGDWLYIAPGRRHRVEWTEPGCVTIWLAVHFPE